MHKYGAYSAHVNSKGVHARCAEQLQNYVMCDLTDHALSACRCNNKRSNDWPL